MNHIERQFAQFPPNASAVKWFANTRLKDISPLPEGWLDYFFTTGNVIAETGCIEKQCKILGCQKTYKGSNGITSNFAKHVRKTHPIALRRFSEQNQQWRQRDRVVDTTTKRCDVSNELNTSSEPQPILVNSELNDEGDSEAGDTPYENQNAITNENDAAHCEAAACDSESQHSTSGTHCINVKQNGITADAITCGNLNASGNSNNTSFAVAVRKVNLNSVIAPSLRKRKLGNGNAGRSGPCQPDATAPDSDGDEPELAAPYNQSVTHATSTRAAVGGARRQIGLNWEGSGQDVLQLDGFGRLTRNALDLARWVSERERDENAAFAHLVVSEMRSLPDGRMRDALKIQIMSLIFEAKHNVPESNRPTVINGVKQSLSGGESDEQHESATE